MEIQFLSTGENYGGTFTPPVDTRISTEVKVKLLPHRSFFACLMSEQTEHNSKPIGAYILGQTVRGEKSI